MPVAPPETIDTTASLSSLVVRSRSGKLEQVERHRVTDIYSSCALGAVCSIEFSG